MKTVKLVLMELMYLLIAWYMGLYTVVKRKQDLTIQNILKVIIEKRTHFFIGLVFSLLIIILMIISGKKKEKKGYYTDFRGMAFDEKGVKGTARWLSQEEAKEVYEVTDIAETRESVFGQFGENGKEVIAYKDLQRGNHHFIVLGNSGAGKSYTFVRTELIQTVLRKESFVTTDASGELYVTMAQYCKNNGYKVKVLNLHYPQYSMGWNCLKEVIDRETERLDSTKLTNFVSIFMHNSSDGKEETFWYEGAGNLLKATIGLLAYRREVDIIQGLKSITIRMLDMAEKDTETKQRVLEKCHLLNNENNYCSIKNIKKEIIDSLTDYGYKESDMIEYFRQIENNSRPFTIAEVMRILLIDCQNLKQWQKSFSDIPYAHPAAIAFSIFNNASVKEEVKASTHNGLCTRMNIFSDSKLRTVLSEDDIVLDDFNKEKTACFVIFNNKTASAKGIMSLFFGFLFNDCAASFDREEAFEKAKIRKNSRLPVSVVMDEFYSIGYIDNFINFITNSRKSRINISIILQYSRQLFELYGNNDATGIMSSCEVAILLNCNDKETAEYFSQFMTGVSTVVNETRQIDESDNKEKSNLSSQSRNLMTIDEFRTMDQNKCLIIRRGQLPLIANSFPYVQHPAYINGELIESNPFEKEYLKNINDKSFGNLTYMDVQNGRFQAYSDSTLNNLDIYINPPETLIINDEMLDYVDIEVKDKDRKVDIRDRLY